MLIWRGEVSCLQAADKECRGIITKEGFYGIFRTSYGEGLLLTYLSASFAAVRCSFKMKFIFGRVPRRESKSGGAERIESVELCTGGATIPGQNMEFDHCIKCKVDRTRA